VKNFRLALFFCLFLLPGCENRGSVVSRCSGDADGDGIPDLLLIRSSSRKNRIPVSGEAWGDSLEIRLGQGKNIVFPLPSLRPLAVQTGDIDGDGREEIALMVYKTAVFDPVLAKRPFFYRLEDEKLKPVWRGSRFSRPADDFRLFDFDDDGITELVSLEHPENGGRVFTLYRWHGFGFEWICQSEELPAGIRFVTPDGGRPVIGNLASWMFRKKLYYDEQKAALFLR
jgi:hypothetical protein